MLLPNFVEIGQTIFFPDQVKELRIANKHRETGTTILRLMPASSAVQYLLLTCTFHIVISATKILIQSQFMISAVIYDIDCLLKVTC